MECISLTRMVFNNASLISFVGSRSLYRKGHSWSETIITWSSSWGQNCVISGPWCYGKGYGWGQIWWTAQLADGDPEVWTELCGPVRSRSGYICHHNWITLSCYFSIFMDFFISKFWFGKWVHVPVNIKIFSQFCIIYMYYKRITSFQQFWQKTAAKLSTCTSLIAIHICIRMGTFRKMLIQIHTNLLKNYFLPNIAHT